MCMRKILSVNSYVLRDCLYVRMCMYIYLFLVYSWVFICIFYNYKLLYGCVCSYTVYGGARGVIVIVVGNEHGDPISNPGRD